MSRKSYTEEFKVEALNLVKAIGITKASAELGVTAKTLRTWSDSKSTNPTKSSKNIQVAELEAELRRAKKEIKNLKLINDVLKKSTAIFSKDQIGD